MRGIMRITNKIMQRNNLTNINTNKINEDRLSTQMSTEKKINRPSDDPVVAIRALRLRSSVTEVSQYYSKNIPDAESWINVTQDALNNLTQILTNLIAQCNKGSNNYLETEDREIILEQIKSLAKEIYATGDADYAGRYVFTGHRTDTSLSFTEETNQYFDITEQLGVDAIDDVTKVYTDKLLDINASNYMDDDMNVTEQGIDAVTCHRIRLAYKDCVGDGSQTPSITFKQLRMQQKMDENDQPMVDDDGNPIYEPVIGADGKPVYDDVTWDDDVIQTIHSYEDPYSVAANDPDAIVYVPETGEILLGENRFNQLASVKDDASTVKNEGEIRVTYQKSHWDKGDLRPQHYFACTSDPDDPEKRIDYNPDYLTADVPSRQEIEYDVGFNQTIRVNSTADECFKHGIGREADDLINAMQNVKDLESVKAKLQDLMKEAEGDEEKMARLQDQLDAVDKALTLAKDKEQKLFESSITAFQGYLEDANLCVTNCGNRGSKLALVENRMQTQKTTFETLKSNNEDVDIAEVTIQLKSAGLVYEAALLAAGKVMQSTLLNYI